MSTNVRLALIAAVIWGGAYFWYFRGVDRIKADVMGLAAWLRLRRKG